MEPSPATRDERVRHHHLYLFNKVNNLYVYPYLAWVWLYLLFIRKKIQKSLRIELQVDVLDHKNYLQDEFFLINFINSYPMRMFLHHEDEY